MRKFVIKFGHLFNTNCNCCKQIPFRINNFLNIALAEGAWHAIMEHPIHNIGQH